MTIVKKLVVSFSAMTLISAALAGGWWLSANALTRLLDQSVHAGAEKTERIAAIQTSALELRLGQRGTILYSFLNRADEARKGSETFARAAERIDRITRDLRPQLETEAGKVAIADIEKSLSEWKPIYARIESLAKAGSNSEELQQNVARTLELAAGMDRAAAELVAQQKRLNAETVESASAFAKWSSTILAAVAVLLCALVLRIVSGISQALRSATNRLRDASQQVASAAGQIATASQSMAQGSSEQAASLEETSASMEEITSMSRKSSEDASAAAESARSADSRLSRGAQALVGLQVSMDEIDTSSSSIAKIIKVIEEIAFQTNILALNAAVEAARAGEAGSGFAVVADEVRNLAQRSAVAAQETAGLIETAIAKSQQGKAKMTAVSDAVREGAVEAVQVRERIEHIRSSSSEQTVGMEQIARAVAQMEQVTQTAAATAEQSAAASEELTAQASALQGIVTNLQALVGK
jgi:methyl-accepting chemotaxis protein